MSTKSEQLMWRRQKVIELKARDMNHSEIARELQVTRQCIVADVHYLRDQVKDSIKVYAIFDVEVHFEMFNQMMYWEDQRVCTDLILENSNR